MQRHLGDRGVCLIGVLVATIAIAIGFIVFSYQQHLHLPSVFVCESYHAISLYITDYFFNRKPATMAWQCTGRSNLQLIENLFTADLIKSERVKNAMLKVCNEDLSGVFFWLLLLIQQADIISGTRLTVAIIPHPIPTMILPSQLDTQRLSLLHTCTRMPVNICYLSSIPVLGCLTLAAARVISATFSPS